MSQESRYASWPGRVVQDTFVGCNNINGRHSMGRWRSWLSHLSNTQKVLSSNLGRLMFCINPLACGEVPPFALICSVFLSCQSPVTRHQWTRRIIYDSHSLSTKEDTWMYVVTSNVVRSARQHTEFGTAESRRVVEYSGPGTSRRDRMPPRP